MTIQFDVPRVHFSDLRLRCGEGKNEILFDPTPLKDLFLYNKLGADVTHYLTASDLCQLVLAWYLHYRSQGGECSDETMKAVRELRDENSEGLLQAEVEIEPVADGAAGWVVNLREIAANAHRGLFGSIGDLMGKLAGLERREPSRLPAYARASHVQALATSAGNRGAARGPRRLIY